jgi:hypothetical protein
MFVTIPKILQNAKANFPSFLKEGQDLNASKSPLPLFKKRGKYKDDDKELLV